MNDITTLGSLSKVAAAETMQSAGGKRIVSHSDPILVAFHASCDLKDLEVARALLAIFEDAALSSSVQPYERRRRAMELVVAAHERLWQLKHPPSDSLVLTASMAHVGRPA